MANKRILITGGAGMLATDLVASFSRNGKFETIALNREKLDVGDPKAVAERVAGSRAEVVIHTAALHVDDCERDPKEAMRINAWATEYLAKACSRKGACFVFISTCGMFGDDIRAYSEYDDPTPKTVYARSKVLAEQKVRLCCDNHLIIRPGWLFGGAVEHRKNFVARRYEEAQSASVVKSVHDKHGSPTYTGDLADRIVSLLGFGATGTYHVSNEGGCTRAEYVQRIIRGFDLDTEVEEVGSEHFPRPADVPDCEILTSFESEYLGLEPLPPWEAALDRYIQSIRS